MSEQTPEQKQSEVEKLYQLLHALNRQQVKVLRKYLVGFSTRNEAETKMLELADYLLEIKGETPDIDTCSHKIYNAPRDSRIEKLKNRLYNKVLDSLAIDINIQRDDYEDEVHPIMIRLKKKATVFQIIRFTPLRETLGMEILNDIIYVAKKYELYNILIDHLQLIKYMKAWREGPKVFQKYEELIHYYEKCSQASFRALDNYYKLIMHTSFSAKSGSDKMIPFLEDCIAKSKYDYQMTQSPIVGYFLRLFEMAYYQELKDFKKAKNAGLEMQNMIKNNISVYRKQRMGFCLGNITQCDIYLGNYQEALNLIRQSTEKYIVKNSSDYFTNKELEFEALFHMGDIEKASVVIQELRKTNALKHGDFRYAKFDYFEACLFFKQGDFKACIKMLSKKFTLSKDKLGWELAIRALSIMSHIEQGDLDRAQTLVGNLQKHIDRNASQTDLKPRDQLILKLFRELEKDGFKLDRLSHRVEKIYQNLCEQGKPHSWQVLTPELIPVHIWLEKKLKFREPAKRSSRHLKAS